MGKMGKGLIIGSLGNGQYSVQLQFDKNGLQDRITAIDAQISDLNTRIAAMDDGIEKNLLELRVKSLQKAKERYQTVLSTTDPTIDAWCTDLSFDLQGEVGTIEVIRNRDKGILLRPNYDQTAAYDQDRDGQLAPALEVGPYTNFFNMAATPGMQKWKPIYRVGAITNISGDNCDITLDNILSSQQDLGVNQTSILASVPIDYMDCNGEVFAVDDRVIVEFTGNSWASPKVIGFESEPQNCKEFYYACRWHYNGEGDPWTRTYEKATAYGKFVRSTGLFEWIDIGDLVNYILTNGWDIIDAVTVRPVVDDATNQRLYGNGCDIPYLQYEYASNYWAANVESTVKPQGIVHRLPNGKVFSFQTWDTVFLLLTEADTASGYRYKKMWKYTINPKSTQIGGYTHYEVGTRTNDLFYVGDVLYIWNGGNPIPASPEATCHGWHSEFLIDAFMPYQYYVNSREVDLLYGQGDDNFDDWADGNPYFPDYSPFPPCQGIRTLKCEIESEQDPYTSETCQNEQFIVGIGLNRFSFFGLDYPDACWERFQGWIDNGALTETILAGATGSPWRRVASSENYFIRRVRLDASPYGALYEPPTLDDDDKANYEGWTYIEEKYRGIKKLSIRIDSGDSTINYFRAQVMDAGQDRVFSATIDGNGNITAESYSTGTYNFESGEIILIDFDNDIRGGDIDVFPSNYNYSDMVTKRVAKSVELGAPSSAGVYQRIFRK